MCVSFQIHVFCPLMPQDLHNSRVLGEKAERPKISFCISSSGQKRMAKGEGTVPLSAFLSDGDQIGGGASAAEPIEPKQAGNDYSP